MEPAQLHARQPAIAPRWKARPSACATVSTRCGGGPESSKSIRLTGGGAHSAAGARWSPTSSTCRWKCRAQTEGAAFGAALQALWAPAEPRQLTISPRSHASTCTRTASRSEPSAGCVPQRRHVRHQRRTARYSLARLRRASIAEPRGLGEWRSAVPHQRSMDHERTIPTSATKRILSRASAASRSRGASPTTRWRSRSTTPASAIGDKTMAEHLRFAVCYWHTLLQRRPRSVRPGYPQLSVGEPSAPLAARRGQARRRVRILHQAGRAVLLLPRHRPGAGRRGHRRVREEPAAHGRPGQASARRPPASSCCGARPTCSAIRAT